MKNTIIRYLSAIILINGLWTSIAAQEKLKIAVIPKSNIAIFWKSVLAGAKLGAVASGSVEVVWRAPSKDDDLPQQIPLIEQCINEGASGIVLAPLDKEALAEPIAKALKKRIPVLIFDSALKGTLGKDFISIVGIDNRKAGKIAGGRLVKLLGGKGKVVMLRVVAGQSNISNREEGFLEELAKYKGIKLIEKNRYVSGSAEEIMNECMMIADKLKEADGVFCSYEQSTMGMLFALQKLNLTGKVKFVGFDSPVPPVEALKKGEIDALITQDPVRMGYFCVKTIVDHIRGKKVPSKIDIDVRMITPININDDDIKKLLALPSVSE
jgi:ribose transport system substrate-binding protein